MAKKNENEINKKILITGIILFILILFSFNQVYKTANLINNEISYKNYLAKQNNIKINPLTGNQEIINQTLQNNLENKPNDKIKFPIYIQLILAITFFTLLKLSGYLVDLHYLNKKQKRIDIKSLNS